MPDMHWKCHNVLNSQFLLLGNLNTTSLLFGCTCIMKKIPGKYHMDGSYIQQKQYGELDIYINLIASDILVRF